MGWHTVVVLDHDTWREAQKDPKAFFSSLNKQMTGRPQVRNTRIVSGTVLARFHNTESRLRKIRRIAES